jgi:hypothetical protein
MTTMFAVHAPRNHSTGGKGLAALEFPQLPDFELYGHGPRQPYHLEIWCEKTTMDVPTDLEQVIFDQATLLLEKVWDRRRKVRLIGVGWEH